ncbi:hypothetical protein [Parapedobacter sp.]
MKKDEKFEPKDSIRHPREREQVVTQKADLRVRKSPDTASPALKRKFSEQPPTKHNSKT